MLYDVEWKKKTKNKKTALENRTPALKKKKKKTGKLLFNLTVSPFAIYNEN